MEGALHRGQPGPDLDKYGLGAVPTSAFFDEEALSSYSDGWVRMKGEARGEARGRAASVLDVLATRGFVVAEADQNRLATCADPVLLSRCLVLAVTAPDAATFARELDLLLR